MDGSLEINFHVPQEHACYPHHFPEEPIVPAALLMSWVIEKIEINIGLNVISLKSVKFLAVVRPGEIFKMRFVHNKEKQNVTFDAFSEKGILCKGIVSVNHSSPIVI